MDATTAELEELINVEFERMQAGDRQKNSDNMTRIQRILNSPVHRRLIERFLGSAALMKVWDEEPHLRYNLLKDKTTPPPTIIVTPDQGDSFMRLALGTAPIKDYIRCPPSIRCLFSSVHVGQRKLLINEVQFMTLHGDKADTVVYIGAAGGHHTPALCELFPLHRFLLYDPAPFSKPLMDYMRKNPTRVAVYNELFPPQDKKGKSYRELMAAVGREGNFLLISDIRRRDVEHDSPTNEDVMADMDLQRDICMEMRPRAAHLKCRLPYFDPETRENTPDVVVSIPKGVFYFQPWCGHKSTETRLIIEPPFSQQMSVSSKWYESALYFHNTVTRVSRFNIAVLAPLDTFLGTIYDRCFDCSFERYVIWQYLTTQELSDEYNSMAAIFSLLKKFVGREDDRLLENVRHATR